MPDPKGKTRTAATRSVQGSAAGVSRRAAIALGVGLGALAPAKFAAAEAAPAEPGERYITGAPVPDLPTREISARSALARLAGVDLWYWDTGGPGEPLVLLHPATGSGHIWGYQQAAFAAAGYRTIGYSRRGFRGSPAGDLSQPGTGAGDLALLADHLGLGAMHIVGSAAGGFVAGSFAHAWPERVRSLTIACSIVSIADPAMRKIVPWLFEPWWNEVPHDVRELSPSYRAANPAGHARWNELHDLSHEGVEAVNQPAGSELATLATMAGIAVPTLMISGDADLLAPPPVARLLHSTIPSSELTILTECGHSAYWERPEEFNTAVLDFVGRHSI